MIAALDVADAFFSAIERGDIDRIAEIYSPSAEIWHNTDGIAQSVDENLRVLGWLVRNIPKRKYLVIRRVSIPGGFLQQHVLHLETKLGLFEMHACIVAMVEGGRIHRLEEYLDSADTARMRAALGV
jgi:ketosteroid isomerase-like protein